MINETSVYKSYVIKFVILAMDIWIGPTKLYQTNSKKKKKYSN